MYSFRSVNVLGDDIDAQAIVKKAEEQLRANAVYSISRMEVHKPGLPPTWMDFESYVLVKGSVENSLSVYLTPALLKGTAMLMVGDDMWMRSASSGRVRKLGTMAKNKALSGSDFSYADFNMNTWSLLDNYTVSLEKASEKKAGKSCYKLRFSAIKDKEAPYTQLVVYITHGEFYFVQIDFYQKNAVIKTLEISDYKRFGDKAYPLQLVMTNCISGTSTALTTSEVELNSSRVKDELFTVDYLEQMK